MYFNTFFSYLYINGLRGGRSAEIASRLPPLAGRLKRMQEGVLEGQNIGTQSEQSLHEPKLQYLAIYNLKIVQLNRPGYLRSELK